MSEPKNMGKFHPDLLSDWDYANNTDIDPMQASASSTEVVHWVCAVGSIHQRQSTGQGRLPDSEIPLYVFA